MKEHGQPAGTVRTDIIIGETKYTGRGLGAMLVKKIAEKIFKEIKAPKIIIDPDPTNMAATRCYEKCGFRRVRQTGSPSFFDASPGKLLLIELKR